MKPRFALRSSMPWWRGPALIAAAAIVTFLLSAIVIRWAGGDPISAFRYMFISPLQTKFGFTESILSATPLVFTGAAVAIAFRAGYWRNMDWNSRGVASSHHWRSSYLACWHDMWRTLGPRTCSLAHQAWH